MQSSWNKWLIELVPWLLDSFNKTKAIKRNQSLKMGEGVMKRFFGESSCYCYLVICLKSFQSWLRQNKIRITCRHRWDRLQLLKCHPVRLSAEQGDSNSMIRPHLGRVDPVVCWLMFKNQLPGNKPTSSDFLHFSTFLSINTPTMANFQLPVWTPWI